jgi:hypothetical protein
LPPGHWDAVVDVSGYVPRHVGQAMDALGDRAGRYLFISSHAVYQHAGVAPGMPATPLETTVADVLAWDRQRGEPPLTGGFTAEQERTVLAQHDRASQA